MSGLQLLAAVFAAGVFAAIFIETCFGPDAHVSAAYAFLIALVWSLASILIPACVYLVIASLFRAILFVIDWAFVVPRGGSNESWRLKPWTIQGLFRSCVLIAVALGIWRHWTREPRAIERVRRLDGVVASFSGASGTTDDGDLYCRIDHEWRGADYDLRYLADMPRLRFLTVRSDSVADDGIGRIGVLWRLRELWLDRNAQRGTASLSALSHLTELESLRIYHWEARDEDLEWLGDARRLSHLEFSNVPGIDGRLFQVLPPDIRSITMNGCEIRDEALGYLDRCPTLRAFRSNSRKISDAGVANLARLDSLRVLCFDSPKITDSSVELLLRMPYLEVLMFGDAMGITADGKARLAKKYNVVRWR